MEKLRLLVMADLPADSRRQRKVAREFGKALFKLGFAQLQGGVYTRLVDGRTSAESWKCKLKAQHPEEGTVRLMMLTERQFESSELIAGEEAAQEDEVGSRLDIFL